MTIELGIAPIGWSNDDLPELGGDITLEQCLSDAKKAGYSGVEKGGKFPMDPADAWTHLGRSRHPPRIWLVFRDAPRNDN